MTSVAAPAVCSGAPRAAGHPVGKLDAFLSEVGLAVVERYGFSDRRSFSDEQPGIITIATGANSLPGSAA